MLVPRSLGGDELDPMTVCEVVEELPIRDGAVGWCAMIGACNGLFGGPENFFHMNQNIRPAR